MKYNVHYSNDNNIFVMYYVLNASDITLSSWSTKLYQDLHFIETNRLVYKYVQYNITHYPNMIMNLLR